MAGKRELIDTESDNRYVRSHRKSAGRKFARKRSRNDVKQ